MGKIHDTADFKYEKFNGCYRISTVGFLVQQYYNAVKKEVANEAKRMAKFKVYMAKYEIKMAQYKNFIDIHWGCDSAYDSPIKTFEKEKIPRTRSTILEHIFANWNVRSNKEQKNGLEKSLENIGKFTDADQGFYMPHPLDGMFVIDTADPLRKLDLLESKIDDLQKKPFKIRIQKETASTTPVDTPIETFASVVDSTPRAKPAVRVAGKRCAVYVAAQKGTTKKSSWRINARRNLGKIISVLRNCWLKP